MLTLQPSLLKISLVFKSHDEWLHISIGDPKKSEHLMLTKSQWEKLSTKAKEGSAGTSSSGDREPRGDKKK